PLEDAPAIHAARLGDRAVKRCVVVVRVADRRLIRGDLSRSSDRRYACDGAHPVKLQSRGTKVYGGAAKRSLPLQPGPAPCTACIDGGEGKLETPDRGQIRFRRSSSRG